MRSYNRLIPFLVAIVFAVVTLLTLDDYGITWDERYYFNSAEEYIQWLKKPQVATIDECWKIKKGRDDHPPLCKVASGISWQIFNKKFGKPLAYRIPSVLFVFVLISALFVFTSRLYGNIVALLVTTSFFFLPRVFFHSHIAAMDYPVMAMWFLTTYSYWRGIEDRKWMICSSIFMGAALLTKINALFIYIPVFFYWAMYFWKDFMSFLRRKPLVHSVKRIVSGIIYMVVIPPAMFVALWPWLWKHTLTRFMEYISLSTEHKYIPVYYFGKIYSHAPWHYPFILAVITLPLIILIPFFIGVFRVKAGRHRRTKVFILLNALLPLIVISHPRVPKYDGVRLFLSAFPFICMISGVGMYYVFDLIKKLRWKTAAISVYALLLCITIFQSNIKYHPYQSSYFSEIVGGIKGADRIGMELEYWGHPYKEGVAWLNENAEPGSEIAVRVVPRLARFGLREDLKLVDGDSIEWLFEDDTEKYVMYINRKGFLDRDISDLEKGMRTVFTVERHGAVLLRILKCDNTRWVEFLKGKKILSGYASDIPLLTFRIDERITLIGDEFDDYMWERARLDSLVEPSYILPSGEARDFYHRVRVTGGDCKYETVGPFQVYYDFIAPRFDREPIPRHKWRASSNYNQKDVDNAIDGDIDTRWTTHTPQRRGMYYELDLGGIHKVNGICMLFPGYLNDYPDGYRLDVSVDGEKWENVLSFEKAGGSYFWLGERFFWRPGHDRRDISFKPALVRFLRITQTGIHDKYWSIQEVFVFGTRERQLEKEGDFSALIRFLDTEDIKYVYTDESLSARLAYETRGRIKTLRQYYIIIHHRFREFLREEREVKPVVHFGKDMAIVLTQNWADFFESALDMYRMRWKKNEIGVFNVYSDIEPSVGGKIISRDRFVPFSSHNSSDCRKAVDGDMGTRWSTESPQEPGMYYGLDLGRVVEVCGVRFYHGESRDDYPHKYEIAVSLDGKDWEKVDYSYSERYYWAGFTFLRMGHSQIDIGFPCISARYLKITQTGSDRTYYWSIHELEVTTK